MSETSQLIARFVENRDGLSETDLDALITELRTQPHLGVVLRSQLTLDDLLSQKLALDRRKFAQAGHASPTSSMAKKKSSTRSPKCGPWCKQNCSRSPGQPPPAKGGTPCWPWLAPCCLPPPCCRRFFAGIGTVAGLAEVSGDGVVLGP